MNFISRLRRRSRGSLKIGQALGRRMRMREPILVGSEAYKRGIYLCNMVNPTVSSSAKTIE